MGIEEDRLKKELTAKEEQLLENSIRNDAAKLAEFIDDACIEFSASGKQSKYRSGILFETTDGVSYIDSNTVRLIDLSENCALLVYVSVKVNKNIRMKSNCSSIWKKTDGKWKIAFHQATICSE